jgi:adenosylcobinamide kinase/adenosylcobinamide-phosphate guanylyltransferase
MEIRLAGTGGTSGWPQPDCRCASCAAARSAGQRRAPTRVIVDGVLRIDRGGPSAEVPGEPRPGDTAPGTAAPRGTAPDAARYRVARVPGGWDVTGPDGDRLLAGDPPGDGPGAAPPDGTMPYDIVLLDLLGNPAQLGALRRRGLVRDRTVVAVLHADHRVRSGQELARRCGYWGGVVVPRDGDVLTAPRDVLTAPRDVLTAPRDGLTAPRDVLTAPRDVLTAATGIADPAGDPGGPRRVLVLGGARSGKSRYAELRLAAEPRVTYLAAGPYPAGAQPADADWAGRVAAHRARRPVWWRTVEGTDVAGVLRSESGAVLLDGAGTWLAAVLEESGAWAGTGGQGDGAQDDGDQGDGDQGDGDQGDGDQGDGDQGCGDGEPAAPARAAARVAARVEELLEAWRQTRARVVAVSDEVGSGVHPASHAGRVFRDQLGWLNQRLAAESEETVLMVAGRALTLPS